MAAKLSASIPEVVVPAWLVDRIGRDRDAGIDHACRLITDIRSSGAFDGVHLVPVSRYRELSARLERMRISR
jgi:hypothetical protein